MSLQQQLEALIEESPMYGVPSEVMAKAITPILKSFADQLEHLEYFLLESVDQSWVISIFESASQPKLEKKVIYAFPTAEDAIKSQEKPNPEIVAKPIPITHFLFQLFAVKQIDSIIFMDKVNNSLQSKEIYRSQLAYALAESLQQIKSEPTNIPPNYA